MRLIERFILLGIPELRIPPKWKTLWATREHGGFTTVGMVTMVAAGILHLLHIPLVDIPMKLEPASLWQTYRISIAALAFFCTGAQWLLRGKTQRFYSQWPYFIWGTIQSYYQAKTMMWSDQVPYGFVLVLPLIITVPLRRGPLFSVLSILFFYGIGFEFWGIHQPLPAMVSGAVLATGVVAMLRSRMSVDVGAFIAVQENIETQSKLIESQMDLNNQIKSFLPKVIYDRFLKILRSRRSTSLQAMDEVLRLRQTLVSCMYSDIRGYTELSKGSVALMSEKIIPNIRRCTEIVEENNGVSRLVGDLVFAYFDEAPDVSILRSAVCAMEIFFFNADLNRVEGHPEIRRYMILSFGEVLLGNVGGGENAREITVMGSPANLLSRIDQLTKHPKIREVISESKMILSSDAAALVQKIVPEVSMSAIRLNDLDVQLRDFPEEKELFTFEMSKTHYLVIQKKLKEILSHQGTSFEGEAA